MITLFILLFLLNLVINFCYFSYLKREIKILEKERKYWISVDEENEKLHEKISHLKDKLQK